MMTMIFMITMMIITTQEKMKIIAIAIILERKRVRKRKIVKEMRKKRRNTMKKRRKRTRKRRKRTRKMIKKSQFQNLRLKWDMIYILSSLVEIDAIGYISGTQ